MANHPELKRMSEITEDQRIAILVYKEDHPEATLTQIHDATGVYYQDITHVSLGV